MRTSVLFSCMQSTLKANPLRKQSEFETEHFVFDIDELDWSDVETVAAESCLSDWDPQEHEKSETSSSCESTDDELE